MALQLGKLAKRSTTTLVGAVVLLALLLFCPKPVFHGVLMVMGVIGTIELRQIVRGFGYELMMVPVVFALAYGIGGLYIEALPLSWLPYLCVVLAGLISITPARKVTDSLPVLGVTLMGCAYLGFSLIGLSYVLTLEHGSDPRLGRYLVVFCFLLVWMGDSAAYLIGSTLGKHKIAKVISPNKSLQGAIANFAGNFCAAWIGKSTLFPELTTLHVIYLTAIFGGLGLFGDLIESSWKRGSDIKDSGSIFPGHGGVMDRVDSIYLTVPLFYVFMRWVYTV